MKISDERYKLALNRLKYLAGHEKTPKSISEDLIILFMKLDELEEKRKNEYTNTE